MAAATSLLVESPASRASARPREPQQVHHELSQGLNRRLFSEEIANDLRASQGNAFVVKVRHDSLIKIAFDRLDSLVWLMNELTFFVTLLTYSVRTVNRPARNDLSQPAPGIELRLVVVYGSELSGHQES